MIYTLVCNILLLDLVLITVLIFIKVKLVIYMDFSLGHVLVLKWIVCDFELLGSFRYPTVVKLPLPIMFLVGVALLLLWLLVLLLRRHCHSSYWFGGCYGASVSRDFVAVV